MVDLPNGLKVAAVRSDALPLVQVRWVFGSGRNREAPELLGSGLMLQRVMRHGSESIGPRQFTDQVDHLGARMGGGVSIDSAIVSLSGLSVHLWPLLDLATDVALRPGLSEIAVAAERLKALAVHRHEWAKVDTMAAMWMAYSLYGAHPYGLPRTTMSGLKRSQVSGLAALHQSIADPADGMVLVVGKVDVDAVVGQLSQRFASLSSTPRPPAVVPPPPRPPNPGVVMIEHPSAESCVISVGLPAIPRNHADFDALQVANQVFGGSASARLFRELRDRRSLSYGAYSILDCGRDAGDITASITVAPEKAGEGFSALLGVLGDMASGALIEAEVEHAKRHLVGALSHRSAGLSGLASLTTAAWINGLGEHLWADQAMRLAEVDLETACTMARRWFQPDQAVMVVVGSAGALNSVESQLAPMGLTGERRSMAALDEILG
jgi:zinc protease